METYDLNRFCPDSDCAAVAEPEEELTEGGLLRWWICGTCGTEFGYVVIKDDAQAGTCALGIPEGVRRVASAPQPDQSSRVFLGATIGRRPQ